MSRLPVGIAEEAKFCVWANGGREGNRECGGATEVSGTLRRPPSLNEQELVRVNFT